MKITTVAVALILVLFSCDDTNAQSVARKLDDEFRATVPASAPKHVVVPFLTTRGITPYEDQKTHTVRASLPDIERHLLVRSGVYMSFHFNSDDQLTSYEIKAIATGP